MRLIVVRGPERVGPFELRPGANVVGRAAQCAVRLPSPRVSRRHAVIQVEGGRVVARDLESHNGILDAEGRRVAAMPMPPGSRLQVGDYLLVLEGDAEDDLELEDEEEEEVELEDEDPPEAIVPPKAPPPRPSPPSSRPSPAPPVSSPPRASPAPAVSSPPRASPAPSPPRPLPAPSPGASPTRAVVSPPKVAPAPQIATPAPPSLPEIAAPPPSPAKPPSLPPLRPPAAPAAPTSLSPLNPPSPIPTPHARLDPPAPTRKADPPLTAAPTARADGALWAGIAIAVLLWVFAPIGGVVALLRAGREAAIAASLADGAVEVARLAASGDADSRAEGARGVIRADADAVVVWPADRVKTSLATHAGVVALRGTGAASPVDNGDGTWDLAARAADGGYVVLTWDPAPVADARFGLGARSVAAAGVAGLAAAVLAIGAWWSRRDPRAA